MKLETFIGFSLALVISMVLQVLAVLIALNLAGLA